VATSRDCTLVSPARGAEPPMHRRPSRPRKWLLILVALVLLVSAVLLVVRLRLGRQEIETFTVPRGGVLSGDSLWRWDVRRAPVAADSRAQVAEVVRQIEATRGHAAFNAYQYGMSWYSVGAGQSRTRMLFSNCQNKPATPVGLYGEGGQFEEVPIPDDAIPTVGTDSSLSIYQPSSDTLWDFWKAYHDSAGWHACWGGRIDDFSTSLGRFTRAFGASASGLAKEAGVVSINDVKSGEISHAVALSLPGAAVSRVVSWPALRTDGRSTASGALAEGVRLRLDPTVDVDALHLSPIGTMVAKAAQKYGFILTDKAGVVAIPAESPTPTEAVTGTDPWVSLMGGLKPYQLMNGFPWSKLEVLPNDYGKN